MIKHIGCGESHWISIYVENMQYLLLLYMKCDIIWVFFSGCGQGKYLHINKSLYKVGSDHSGRLADIAHNNHHEVGIPLLYSG